ncbi:MAG: electron transfer flavoprotein subunit alpha/FixB family protein [Planctomycetota bacterium]|jgi:electron transfer flavoprotein alpha subunit
MNSQDGVCTFSERHEVALELLAAGRELTDGELIAIAAESENDAGARELLACGATRVLSIEPVHGAAAGDLHVEALERALDQEGPAAVLIGATKHGTDVASRLAQRLTLGCASECTALARRDGALHIERTCMGRFISREVVGTRPALATVQPRRFSPPRADASRTADPPQPLRVDVAPSRTPIVDTRHREPSSLAIDKADVVVAIGRGLRGKRDLRMIEELARTLGGVVGASRPLTDDLEWLSPTVKVGLSGITVKPKLYIACGISGQIEHNVGMRESGVVVAINSDPAAPIMSQADYCITGDLHEIVPALIEAVESLR